MTVEFHLPAQIIKDWIIEHMMTKLVELHRLNKEIARVEVYFKENSEVRDGAKICEIELTVYGDSLFVRRNAESFEQASREAIEALTIGVEKQVRQQRELPDTVTSTVKI